jgi:alginate O-acetyltransferase complex protein AlgI
MLFNSYSYLLGFLPVVLAVMAVINKQASLRIPFLVFVSLLFYGFWNPAFVLLLVGEILVNWVAARLFATTGNKSVITGAIILDLAVLGTFKYVNFFAANLAALSGLPLNHHLDLILPLGISFFTFHHIMYLVDLRRGRAEITTLDRYALYICFFPQAAAGPLARWSEVGRQFGRDAFAPGWEERWALGITFLIVGLIEKAALGDPIGQLVNPIYRAAANAPLHEGSGWLALGFAFQIFYDFAGYSDMAIGTALLLGIQLPFNFNAPFRSSSILMFWQRWNMTVSRFLRDYVFVPLSDMRIAGTRHTIPQYVAAILITMALCGLWHGAGWNYVLWGALQGVAIVIALGWRRVFPPLPKPIGWALTIGFFILSGVIFRTGSLSVAWNVYSGLGSLPHGKILGKAWIIGLGALLAVALPATRDLSRIINWRPRVWVSALLGLIGVALLVQLGGDQSYEFIYFRF